MVRSIFDTNGIPYIAAGSLLQLSKCLSVNSSRLYVQDFVLTVFATFPIIETEVQLGAPLLKQND